MPHDPINHPPHYNSHPSGVECITITEHMNFNIGNAVKYLWRSGLKEEGLGEVQDLQKAAWYIQREIHRRIQAYSPEQYAKQNSECPFPSSCES